MFSPEQVEAMDDESLIAEIETCAASEDRLCGRDEAAELSSDQKLLRAEARKRMAKAKP